MTAETVRTFSTGYEHYLEGAGAHAAVDLRGRTIVLDTNILLSLYAMHDKGLADLLAGLTHLKTQLFMPAQVQVEFWRNRDAVLRRHLDSARSQRHEQVRRETRALLPESDSRTFPAAERKAWEQRVTAFFTELRQTTQDDVLRARANTSLMNPAQDPVVTAMDSLFAGRVGPAPSAEELQVLRAHFDQRCLVGMPPGYMDASKTDGGYGDYALWAQVVDHARGAQRPVVIVTNDQKEDWWRLRRTGDPINARFELVQELGAEASVGLDLLTLPQFLDRLEAAGVDFDESTIDEVEAATSSANLVGAPEADDDPEWLVEQLVMLVDRLRDQGWTQHAQVLKEAVKSDLGMLDRAEVLRLLGKAADEKLTGFTRVFVTAQRQLEAEGILPLGLVPALAAQYDRPGKAPRFAVPQELVRSVGDLNF